MARGGFEVSMEWDNGTLTHATILSRNGGTLRLRTSSPLHRKGKKVGQYYEYEIKTKKGGTIKL